MLKLERIINLDTQNPYSQIMPEGTGIAQVKHASIGCRKIISKIASKIKKYY